MSTKYKFHDQDELYFLSYSVVYWIDLFTRNEYKNTVLNSWKYCKEHTGMDLYAYCIMTSHIHMIIGTHQDKMEDIMRDMKTHTSKQLRRAINEHPTESRREWMFWMMKRAGRKNSNNIEFQLWQQDNHPIQLNKAKMAHQKLDYIHYNPVEAAIVEKPEDYLYSSARNYCCIKGLIDVVLLDPVLL